MSTEEQTTSVSANARGMERIAFHRRGSCPCRRESAEATDEVHADCLSGCVEAGELHVSSLLEAPGHQRDGGDGDALVGRSGMLSSASIPSQTLTRFAARLASRRRFCGGLPTVRSRRSRAGRYLW